MYLFFLCTHTAGSLIMHLRKALTSHVRWCSNRTVSIQPSFFKYWKQMKTLQIYGSKNILQ